MNLRDFENSVFGFAERNTHTDQFSRFHIAVSYVNQMIRQHFVKYGKCVKFSTRPKMTYRWYSITC